MEIFWVRKLPKNAASLVIPDVPSLYERVCGEDQIEKERILSCFMNIKSKIETAYEDVDPEQLKPVEFYCPSHRNEVPEEIEKKEESNKPALFDVLKKLGEASTCG